MKYQYDIQALDKGVEILRDQYFQGLPDEKIKIELQTNKVVADIMDAVMAEQERLNP